jgi:hypothetical protein
MPRGTCENCGRHDAFVYPVPLTFGRNLFVCARCITLPREWDDDEEDLNPNSNLCLWQSSQSRDDRSM